MSSHNPFRAQQQSPNPTGSSTNPPPSFHTIAGEGETTLNPLNLPDSDLPGIRESAREQDEEIPTVRVDAPLPLLPEEHRTTERRLPIHLDEEPPAYTPTPDLNHGEATLELGPRRPFQRPPQLPPGGPPLQAPQQPLAPTPNSNYPAPSSSPFSSFRRSRNPNNRGGLLQNLAGSIIDQLEQVAATSGIGTMLAPPPNASGTAGTGRTTMGASSPSRGSPAPRHTRSHSPLNSAGTGSLSPAPPPLPPRSTGSTPLSHQPTGNSTRTTMSSLSVPTSASNATATSDSSNATRSSDFARDFYAVGAADGLLNVDPDSSDGESLSQLRQRGERGTPRSRSFEGPGGANAHTNRNRSVSENTHRSPPPSPSSSTRLPRAIEEDNNRPTTTPVPGHILLKDGKILAYPKGFTCSKCFNLGYKRADPKRPCKKCWSKHSRAYTPAILYAPTDNADTTMQRPLPKLSPPQPPSSFHAGPSYTPPSHPPPSNPSTRPALAVTTPPSPNSLRRRGCSHRPIPSDPGPIHIGSGPWPAATRNGLPVLPAGDPRLGGVLCRRCGGTGTMSYFIIDVSTCEDCGGIGRILR